MSLALAGCGGGSGTTTKATAGATGTTGPAAAARANPAYATYRGQLAAAVKPWVAATRRYSVAIRAPHASASAQAAATALFAAANNTFANQLAALNPPSVAQSPQNLLIVAVRALGPPLYELRRAALDSDAAGAADAGKRFHSGVQGVSSAFRALEAQVGEVPSRLG